MSSYVVCHIEHGVLCLSRNDKLGWRVDGYKAYRFATFEDAENAQSRYSGTEIHRDPRPPIVDLSDLGL